MGSTTYKREDREVGFEPDFSFYIQHESLVRGKESIVLGTDPPPDLVAEIEITHPLEPRLPVYATLGIPEIWRYDGVEAEILILHDSEYSSARSSIALPFVTTAALTLLLSHSIELSNTQGMRAVRKWLQMQP